MRRFFKKIYTPFLKRLLIAVLFFFGVLPFSAAKNISSPEPLLEINQKVKTEPATVTVWNRPIVTLRSSLQQRSPAERAERIEKAILDLPVNLPLGSIHIEMVKGEKEGNAALILTAQGLIFGILEKDIDPAKGETLESVSQSAVNRLREFLKARADQMRLPLLFRGIAYSLAATLLFFIFVMILRRLGIWVRGHVEKWSERKRLSLMGMDLGSFLLALVRGVLRLLFWGLFFISVYLWITFVLVQFPFTQPWGTALGHYLIGLVGHLGLGIVKGIPGLFAVLLIFLFARLLAKAVGNFFKGVERGAIWVPWAQPETAKATRRLAMVLIWVFALVVAYPYIPGSETEAFKGISVLLGLMVSLGSAGMVNQVMSGLVIVYSRAFRVGDYVRAGDTEGKVTEIGFLSTKILTKKKEEITIPNAVLVADTLTNYSRLSATQGLIVSTSVTIGYDAPWRQVHSLLLKAAERTKGIRREPKPFVLQKSLSDFFVEYELRFYLDQPENRYEVLSELHGEIQDAFNEVGVQIMSPHFETQPEKKIVGPKPDWDSSPRNSSPPTEASGPKGSGNGS